MIESVPHYRRPHRSPLQLFWLRMGGPGALGASVAAIAAFAGGLTGGWWSAPEAGAPEDCGHVLECPACAACPAASCPALSCPSAAPCPACICPAAVCPEVGCPLQAACPAAVACPASGCSWATLAAWSALLTAATLLVGLAGVCYLWCHGRWAWTAAGGAAIGAPPPTRTQPLPLVGTPALALGDRDLAAAVSPRSEEPEVWVPRRRR